VRQDDEAERLPRYDSERLTIAVEASSLRQHVARIRDLALTIETAIASGTADERRILEAVKSLQHYQEQLDDAVTSWAQARSP